MAQNSSSARAAKPSRPKPPMSALARRCRPRPRAGQRRSPQLNYRCPWHRRRNAAHHRHRKPMLAASSISIPTAAAPAVRLADTQRPPRRWLHPDRRAHGARRHRLSARWRQRQPQRPDPGAEYWLGTAGAVTDTPLDENNDVANANKISQYLGKGKSVTELITTDDSYVVL